MPPLASAAAAPDTTIALLIRSVTFSRSSDESPISFVAPLSR
jgi:hypothetical protein